jgi:hypothetical protein
MEKNKKLVDLYTEFQISSFDKIEMTTLSKVLDYKHSHDVFTKMLSSDIDIEEELMKSSKKIIKEIKKEVPEGILIVDDTILKKPYSKENLMIAKHYDNSEKRVVKGINLLNFVYTSLSNFDKSLIPVAFDIVEKDIIYEDKNFKEKRKSSYTKNELFRAKMEYLVKHKQFNFKYILGDSWFASNENIEYINNINRDFIFRIKKNRLIAFSYEDKINGKFSKISDIDKSFVGNCEVYLKGCSFPVKLTKLYVKNGKNFIPTKSYLITNCIRLDTITLAEIYNKRWRVEEFHKSIKQNLNIEKSPTKTIKTQVNHIFLSFLSFIKLEKIRIKSKTNMFFLKRKLHLEALKFSFQEFHKLKILYAS